MEAHNEPQSSDLDFYDVVIMGSALSRRSDRYAAAAAESRNSHIDSGFRSDVVEKRLLSVAFNDIDL
jgi:hypothetical protein